MHAHTHTCTSPPKKKHTLVHTHTHTMCTHTHIHTAVHTHTHNVHTHNVHTHTHNAHTHTVHTHAHTYTHNVHTHTHTHRRTHKGREEPPGPRQPPQVEWSRASHAPASPETASPKTLHTHNKQSCCEHFMPQQTKTVNRKRQAFSRQRQQYHHPSAVTDILPGASYRFTVDQNKNFTIAVEDF